MLVVSRLAHGTLLQQRIEVICVALLICALIFELIRRRHVMERYAILWLLAGATVLILGLWEGLLTKLAHAVGISYLPSALFAVAFLFVLVMLVQFSISVSRLSDQNTVLAQRVALLQQRLDGDPDDVVSDPVAGGDASGSVGGSDAPDRALRDDDRPSDRPTTPE